MKSFFFSKHSLIFFCVRQSSVEIKDSFERFEFCLRLRISNGLAGFFFGSATDSVQDNLVEALPLSCLVRPAETCRPA